MEGGSRPGQLILVLALGLFFTQGGLLWILIQRLKSVHADFWEDLGSPDLWAAYKVKSMRQLKTQFRDRGDQLDKSTLAVFSAWKWVNRLFAIIVIWMLAATLLGW